MEAKREVEHRRLQIWRGLASEAMPGWRSAVFEYILHRVLWPAQPHALFGLHQRPLEQARIGGHGR